MSSVEQRLCCKQRGVERISGAAGRWRNHMKKTGGGGMIESEAKETKAAEITQKVTFFKMCDHVYSLAS